MTAVSSSFPPLPGDFFNRADVENRRRLERKAQSRGVKLKRLRIITRSQPACVPAGRRSGQNDRLLRLPGPQIYRRTRVGPWVFDQPSDSSSQESVCQIRRVNIKYWFSQISLGHLPNNEIPFEQQTSSTPSQDGDGVEGLRWEVKHRQPTQAWGKHANSTQDSPLGIQTCSLLAARRHSKRSRACCHRNLLSCDPGGTSQHQRLGHHTALLSVCAATAAEKHIILTRLWKEELTAGRSECLQCS